MASKYSSYFFSVRVLMQACDRIPDPFVGFNELDVQWVGEKTWVYEVTLHISPAMRARQNLVLDFEGLDTFATVKLDGKIILCSDNMFLPSRVDVTKELRICSEQKLVIEFEPALPRAQKIMSEHLDHKWICWNVEPSRLAVRKAQYHWGWDWGPLLMTAGPWRPVRLEAYDVRISDLWAYYKVDLQTRSVRGNFNTKVEGNVQATAIAKITLNGQQVWLQQFEVPKGGTFGCHFQIQNTQLWYPHGDTFSIDLMSGETLIDSKVKKIGLRHIQLVQKPDLYGKSFYFRINGHDIFCG